MHEASFYTLENHGVRCFLCPQNCLITDGKLGFCRVRQNLNGILYTLNYAKCSSYAVDPIEKKPLFHFYPGADILSLGTFGCNFTCGFCQNWQIAQDKPETVELPPTKALQMALNLREQGNIGIAYTYSEPSVWYEYVLDTASLVHEQGLKNVLITNGFINAVPFKKLLPVVDALNIDVKGFTDKYYKSICSGSLEKVQKIVELAAASCHVEITYLVIPGLNDTEDEIEKLSQWLAGINKNIPLHFTKYYPNYKMENPATPLEVLNKCHEIAAKYLNYVYLGNVHSKFSNTYCPDCKTVVMDRQRGATYLKLNNTCPVCEREVDIVGEVSL